MQFWDFPEIKSFGNSWGKWYKSFLVIIRDHFETIPAKETNNLIKILNVKSSHVLAEKYFMFLKKTSYTKLESLWMPNSREADVSTSFQLSHSYFWLKLCKSCKNIENIQHSFQIQSWKPKVFYFPGEKMFIFFSRVKSVWNVKKSRFKFYYHLTLALGYRT